MWIDKFFTTHERVNCLNNLHTCLQQIEERGLKCPLSYSSLISVVSLIFSRTTGIIQFIQI